MATRFELVLYGDEPTRLRGAGEDALAEIERIESQLSLYRSDSEVGWINTHATHEPVPVEPRLFRLLQLCARLSDLTDGAFDVTVAPLMRCWGFLDGTGRVPDSRELDAARAITGMHHVQLDEHRSTVRFDREGVELDLGAVGKGYAIERAANILREVGVTSGLLHGGTSTVHAIGVPPDQAAWRVAIRNPVERGDQLQTVDLCDSSLSVSAVHGKSFTDGGSEFGHVIDPRTGLAVEGALAAAVTGPSPTECDALSTALLVLGKSWLPTLAERFPGCTGLAAAALSGGRNERASKRTTSNASS